MAVKGPATWWKGSTGHLCSRELEGNDVEHPPPFGAGSVEVLDPLLEGPVAVVVLELDIDDRDLIILPEERCYVLDAERTGGGGGKRRVGDYPGSTLSLNDS